MSKNTDKGLRNIVILLAAFGLTVLGIDIYEVVAGKVDLNQHIPFFVPAVFGIFILITLKIGEYAKDDPLTFEQAKEKARRDSFLYPDNLPRGRGRDGDIG